MDNAVDFQGIEHVELIASRRSIKPAIMTVPAPDEAALTVMLQAAMSAPDHGAIRPWRFKTIRDGDRDALSDLFEEALRLRDPNADDEAIVKIRSKPQRAPLIVAVGVSVTENHPKVPREEQVVAAACATQNLLLAAHAMGWGAILLTGWPAHDETVKAGLGFEAKDSLIGFVYMGTVAEVPREVVRPDASAFLESWSGAA